MPAKSNCGDTDKSDGARRSQLTEKAVPSERPDYVINPKGSLIVIGGRERKDDGAVILEEVARRANKDNGRLVILTAATSMPEEVAMDYTDVFQRLGVKKIDVVDIRQREDAFLDENAEKVCGADVVFFTGGDQLRITSLIGDSPVYRCLLQNYKDGGTIVGTSAGAAAMSATMVVSGPDEDSRQMRALDMAPGLDLLRDLVVDSHFAERGRITRLLGAVAQNPRSLGIGIDEDTAIIVERDEYFKVLGSGAVYIVDGTGITYTSLAEDRSRMVVSLFNVTLHVLTDGDKYDLVHREPVIPKVEATAS